MKISICPTCGHPRETQGTITKSFVPPVVDPEKKEMKEMLQEALNQLEYLNTKQRERGTTNSVISRISTLLQKLNNPCKQNLDT